ncbi:hypothetical protein K469DRAFT_623462 [Zopfia rhizophila CBS 207.26]|uniref:Wax synthase domain-containing protein n=1 Tax=Zopfia rhizophila CBS 207.26 TaxID=1314779 RepID=A0A6A6EIE2_9PEZI|nr:hypothetical protein K469DRAFT_623462 [Zopfia rhizophila CBS 207.26]
MDRPTFIQQFQIPLLYLSNIVGLGMQPGLARVIATLPTLVFLVAQSAIRKDSQYFGDEYSMNCLVTAMVFVYVDWILLASPDKERWHKIRYDGKQNTVSRKIDAVPSSFLQRVWWGICLATTNRYMGWSNQIKNVPVEVPADYPRWLFIVRKSLRVVFLFLIENSLESYTASTPHGAYRGFEIGKVPIGYDTYPISRQFALSWIHIVITYTSLEMLNCVYGILAVLLYFASPRDCPSMFGDLREMYTVRKSWSVVWHQMMRRVCSTPGIFLVRDVLRLRKGSFASKYLQLFVGFFVSAIIHGGASMLCNRSFEMNHEFAFFIAQAVIIMIEDHTIDFGRYIGLRDSIGWRLIGHVWCIAWVGLSSAPYSSAMISHGLWVHKRGLDVFGIGPQT